MSVWLIGQLLTTNNFPTFLFQAKTATLRWSHTGLGPNVSTTRTICGRNDPASKSGSGSTGDPDATSTNARTAVSTSLFSTTHTPVSTRSRRSPSHYSPMTGCTRDRSFVPTALQFASKFVVMADRPTGIWKGDHLIFWFKKNPFQRRVCVTRWEVQDWCPPSQELCLLQRFPDLWSHTKWVSLAGQPSHFRSHFAHNLTEKKKLLVRRITRNST